MKLLRFRDRPAISLPLRYMLSGFAAFLVAIGWIALAPRQVFAFFLDSGATLAVTHLLVLGWLGSVALGAVYQLLPVLLGVPLRGEWLARALHPVWLAAVAVFVAGFAAGKPTLVWLAGSAAFLVGTAFVWDAARHLRRVPRWDVHAYGMAAALGFFQLTIAAGLVMAWIWRFPFLGPASPRLLAAHAVLGLFGWFGTLIVAVGYQLIPMFAPASEGWSGRLSRPALILSTAGTLGTALALLLAGGRPATWLPWAALALAGYGSFAWDVASILRHRQRNHRDHPVLLHVTVGVGALPVAGALAAATGAGTLGGSTSAHALAVGYLLLTAGLSMMTLGQLGKIVPFLLTLDYLKLGGRPPVPRTGDLYSDGVGRLSFWLLLMGFLGTAAGLWSGWPGEGVWWAAPFPWIALLGAGSYAWGLAGVFLRLRRWLRSEISRRSVREAAGSKPHPERKVPS